MTEKLPPGTLCVVCEDIATGNHYSVPSCNGCKTFFRRAVVNNRMFTCMGNGDCPVNKGVRCACRHCRLEKCLLVGMDKKSIQNDRDRIGYTKRTRKSDKQHPDAVNDNHESRHTSDSPDSYSHEDIRLGSSCLDSREHKHENNAVDPMLERLTTLENNLTLLLSRADIEPYASLDDALAAPSRFHQPISVRITDPIASPKPGMDEKKMPFWRSRIIALYIDWAKSFACFRNLPHADKVALITNHASSYMIMCEAFRTPEHKDDRNLRNAVNSRSALSPNDPLQGLLIKTEASNDCAELTIRLPTEYGSLPADYGTVIPKDYGRPVPGTEGRSEMHTFFDNKLFEDSTESAKASRAAAASEDAHVGWLPTGLHHRRRSAFVGSSPKALSFSLSGLTPVMAAMIDYVMKPFRQLNISTTEFAALQAVMFFDPDTEGIDSASQRNVAAEQKKLLAALHRHIQRTYKGTLADERYANILLRIPTIRKVAAKKNESLQMIDMLNLFALNSLVKETALGVRTSTSSTPALGSTINGDYPSE
ncbi:Ligand-binding domain of nuclear hormone receptor [Trichostrongylus colubriformis]|uniref:Ligand-binding domain of nuclear hormone receptor n=1 Tax=Trichostrongylus colubriformis TaxID=6319 RepID=A0AAN8F460_TRICO